MFLVIDGSASDLAKVNESSSVFDNHISRSILYIRKRCSQSERYLGISNMPKDDANRIYTFNYSCSIIRKFLVKV